MKVLIRWRATTFLLAGVVACALTKDAESIAVFLAFVPLGFFAHRADSDGKEVGV